VTARYVRCYSTPDDETHLETGQVRLSPTGGIEQSAHLAVDGAVIRRMTGPGADWHNAPRPHVAVVLAGEFDVHTSDGGSQRVAQGGVLFVEDTTGKGHRAVAVDGQDRILLLLWLAPPYSLHGLLQPDQNR
jgi:quercetin dioxygenase-like cupin family protein